LLKVGVFELIRYANSKGFYTRLTSNGTLQRNYYKELINTRINSITISLDSAQSYVQEGLSQVNGSWVKAVDNLKFLRDNARSSQVVSVCALVTPSNIREAVSFVDFCSNVLQCHIFLQPAVFEKKYSGHFSFRPAGREWNYESDEVREIYRKLYKKVLHSKLLTPYTFLRMSEKHLRTDDHKWKCKAGRLFFDIMPDGQYYLCQDIRSPEEKNILGADFVSWFNSRTCQETAKRISADCSGCCYSCYVCIQRFFSWQLLDILGVTVMNLYLPSVLRRIEKSVGKRQAENLAQRRGRES